jgi:O-Antigen ligase
VSASGVMGGWTGARRVGREALEGLRPWADPLLGLAVIAVAGDAVIELVDPYRVPPPMAHYVVPALFVVFLGYMVLRRGAAEIWLCLGVAATTLAEVNENSLDLANVQVFQSFFNNRSVSLPVSPFDILFAIAALVSLPRLLPRWRERVRGPEAAAVCLIGLLVLLWFAAVLLDRPVYESARDVRPLLVVPALLLLAAPALADVPAARLARLVVGVGLLKAAEGWVRMAAAVGVPHQGVHIVFYDTTNDVVVVLAMIVVALSTAPVRLALRSLAMAFLAVPLAWSFRRGVLVAVAGLLLASLTLVRRPLGRWTLVAVSVACLIVAAGMNTVLTIASRLPVDRVAPAQPVAAAPAPRPTSSPGVAASAKPAATGGVTQAPAPSPAAEAGDVDLSNKFRLLDAENAIRNVAANPVFGLGPGTDYVVYDDGGQPGSGFLAYAKHTSHVGYLAIALKAGLVGLGLYGAMWALAVADLWRRGSGRERDVLLATLLLFALLNAVFPLVATIRPAVLLGLLLARIATRPLEPS